MQKIIEDLFTARALSIALVIEVGFIVGLYAGRVGELSGFQWGGAAMTVTGSVLLAAIVHGWPPAEPVKAR